MRGKIDIAEVMGRSIKVSVDGTRIYDENSSYIVHPIQTDIRIYNCSDMTETVHGTVVYAADFGTFICPYFRNIEEILENSGFQKVSDEVLYVPYGPNVHTTGSKESHIEWKKNCDTLFKYSVNTTKNNLKRIAKLIGIEPLPDDILSVARRIPDTGIYIGTKVTYYPMSSSISPEKKLGKFNTAYDGRNFITIIYAADGETYLVKNYPRISEILENIGYVFDFDLLIPNYPE